MVVKSLIDSLSRCFGNAHGNVQGACAGATPASADNSIVGDANRAAVATAVVRGQGQQSPTHGPAMAGNQPDGNTGRRKSGRGTAGLELQGREWDALFDATAEEIQSGAGIRKGQRQQQGKGANASGCNNVRRKSGVELAEGAAGSSPRKIGPGSTNADGPSGAVATAEAAAASKNMGSSKPSTPSKKNRAPDVEVGYAEVLAKARRAANPANHRSPTVKRKSPSDRKADIFRSRVYNDASSSAGAGAHSSAHMGGSSRGNYFASRFLSNHEGIAKSLCFANPVRDSVELAEEEARLRNANTMGDNTLNTCEDTITSTLYFDAKYSHVVENRPPMPLFNQFKVDTEPGQEDALSQIVATQSHSSLNMIQLFQEHANTSQPEQQQQQQHHESRGTFQPLPPAAATGEGPPDPVKVMCSSSDESSCGPRNRAADPNQKDSNRQRRGRSKASVTSRTSKSSKGSGRKGNGSSSGTRSVASDRSRGSKNGSSRNSGSRNGGTTRRGSRPREDLVEPATPPSSRPTTIAGNVDTESPPGIKLMSESSRSQSTNNSLTPDGRQSGSNSNERGGGRLGRGRVESSDQQRAPASTQYTHEFAI